MTPEVVFERVSFRYPETSQDIFSDLTLELPRGIVSLVGQNGTGKSTLLLLASGRLLPTEGHVLIRGRDSRELAEESERQALVSFIYQNMEFEAEEPVGELLAFVKRGGALKHEPASVIDDLVATFELGPVLHRRMQEVSKGELQRAILAFSLLYGSPLIAMDEPVFALEARQKKLVMSHLAGLARSGKVTVYYSAHELDLSQEYSDHIVLFSRTAPPRIGPTREIFTRETIERAYEVPFHLLKRREELYRAYLVKLLGVKGDESTGR